MRFLLILTLTVLFQNPNSAIGAENEERPNVLFILIDDFGWNDVGYNGSTFYETPRMDALAEEWMQFDYCYTPSPMCSPTRVSILTGKNPARHGVTQWLSGSDKAFIGKGQKPRVYCPKPQSPGIQASETTLGETFQTVGYDTAFYGKWHMGNLDETGGPKAHGYDSQLAIIEANRCEMFYPFKNKKYFQGAKEGDNFTDLLTDAAVDFVKADRKKPFYLHLAHFAMHAPIGSKDKERAHFEKKAAQLSDLENDRVLDEYAHKPQKLRQDDPEYAGELATLDENIGRVIDALKESGQYENTIVILTGDNGGRSSYFREHPTAMTPLRTGKTFIFEGGIRTPLLIHWPNHSNAGMKSEVPVSSMDFYPTLLEMVGLPSQPKQHIDGVSLVPLFKEKAIERNSLVWHFPHYQGEGSYPASAIREGDLKLIHNYHQDDLLLYDITNDPGETNDLAKTKPEEAARLKEKLDAYLEETGAYIPKPIAK